MYKTQRQIENTLLKKTKGSMPLITKRKFFTVRSDFKTKPSVDIKYDTS